MAASTTRNPAARGPAFRTRDPVTHAPEPTAQAAATFETTPQGLILRLCGRFDADGAAGVWREVLGRVDAVKKGRIELDASAVAYCSMPGIGLILEARLMAEKNGGQFVLTGLKPEFTQLLDLLDVEELSKPAPPRHVKRHLPVEVGAAAYELLDDIKQLIIFVGEFAAALMAAVRRPQNVRWSDALNVAETAGVNALPIIALIGFLMGLIMSFQSAVPLRQFGADIYVANLLGISMTRELGPLVTAIILSGRSGSSFAAEIGTMTVNEEINALKTMGLDPVRFLVVTRVLAAVAVTPILTIFFNLFSLVGGAVVMRSFGYPLVTYLHQLDVSVHVGDIVQGLFKASVFGLLVCGIGCLRGLQTRGGPSAVGLSTTSAVVSGIILIAMADGVFAVLFYILGI